MPAATVNENHSFYIQNKTHSTQLEVAVGQTGEGTGIHWGENWNPHLFLILRTSLAVLYMA